MARFDGKPFVKDTRGRVPNVVIENDEDGNAVLVHQFEGVTEPIGPRPYSQYQLNAAAELLQRKLRAARKTGVIRDQT